jgi:hypothetical protein
MTQALYAQTSINTIINEFSITLLLVILRRLNTNDELGLALLPLYQEKLVEVVFSIPIQAEYDEEAAKFFILIEEILISFHKI